MVGRPVQPTLDAIDILIRHLPSSSPLLHLFRPAGAASSSSSSIAPSQNRFRWTWMRGSGANLISPPGHRGDDLRERLPHPPPPLPPHRTDFDRLDVWFWGQPYISPPGHCGDRMRISLVLTDRTWGVRFAGLPSLQTGSTKLAAILPTQKRLRWIWASLVVVSLTVVTETIETGPGSCWSWQIRFWGSFFLPEPPMLLFSDASASWSFC